MRICHINTNTWEVDAEKGRKKTAAPESITVCVQSVHQRLFLGDRPAQRLTQIIYLFIGHYAIVLSGRKGANSNDSQHVTIYGWHKLLADPVSGEVKTASQESITVCVQSVHQ